MDRTAVAERRLSVLQMLPALDAGGVERGTLEIAAALVEAGHRSLVMSGGGRLCQALEAAGSEHLCWPVGRKHPASLRLVRPLRRLLATERIDILHLRSRLPAWLGWLAWRGLPLAERPRLVTTVHGFYSVNRYSAVMTRGERVIAVSRSIRRYLLESYPRLPAQRITVIHRGVDPQQFPHGFRPAAQWLARWRRELPLAPGTRVLTLAGRLTRLKGHEAFLDLIESLAADGMAVHGLVVGGEDPRRRAYARALRARAARLPVTFLGHRQDLRELMAVSDLVLSLSSQPESFGRTVLEALSLGIPVVGHAHGGVGEILDALYPCGAVAPGDAVSLRRSARALLDAAPPVPADQPFALAAMRARTLALYAELAATDRQA